MKSLSQAKDAKASINREKNSEESSLCDLGPACAEAGNAEVLLTADDQMASKARQHCDVLCVRVENPILWLTEVVVNGAIKNDTGTD